MACQAEHIYWQHGHRCEEDLSPHHDDVKELWNKQEIQRCLLMICTSEWNICVCVCWRICEHSILEWMNKKDKYHKNADSGLSTELESVCRVLTAVRLRSFVIVRTSDQESWQTSNENSSSSYKSGRIASHSKEFHHLSICFPYPEQADRESQRLRSWRFSCLAFTEFYIFAKCNIGSYFNWMSVFLSTTADEVLLKDIKFNKNIYTKLYHMPSVGVCWHSSLASEATLPKRIFKNTLCTKQIFECQVIKNIMVRICPVWWCILYCTVIRWNKLLTTSELFVFNKSKAY